MKQTIELPDAVLVGNKPHIHDELTITVRKNKVIFSVAVDGTGNSFEMDKRKLGELLLR